MVIEREIQILDGQSSGLFPNEPFEKRPVTMIEDFSVSDDTRHQSVEKRPMRSQKETCDDHRGFFNLQCLSSSKC